MDYLKKNVYDTHERDPCTVRNNMPSELAVESITVDDLLVLGSTKDTIDALNSVLTQKYTRE